MALFTKDKLSVDDLPIKTRTFWIENVSSLLLRGLSVPIRFSVEPWESGRQ